MEMIIRNSTSRVTLESPIRYFKGVGPRKAELLAKLGIRCFEDLILKTPRHWENRTTQPTIENDKPQAIMARVLSTKTIFTHTNLGIFKAKIFPLLNGQTQTLGKDCYATVIRRRSLRYDVFAAVRNVFDPGQRIFIYGIPKENPAAWEIETLDFEQVNDSAVGESAHWQRLVPVYPATSGLAQKQLRQLRFSALALWKELAPNWSWGSLSEAPRLRELMTLSEAYAQIHFPKDKTSLEEARKTLAFWEFFLLSLAMKLRLQKTKQIQKPHRYQDEAQPDLFKKLLEELRITLTQAQRKATNDILLDMAKPVAMNRLLQGEVGSGKTIVAIAALTKALESNYQSILIAPTEVLVFQHMLTLKNYFEPHGIRVANLTSETKPKEKAQMIEDFSTGRLPILIGTHALLEPKLVSERLTLIIIDEQHRFGVKQRWALRHKASKADCLILSATPIPRTLALTLYGDLEISTMEELPTGRQLATSRLVDEEKEAWEIAAGELAKGHQLYIVVPAIEEKNVGYALNNQKEKIQTIFKNSRISHLHGAMASHEKEKALREFAQGESQILLSTTVVEVGLDVARATAMIVLGAEHFGLATLHQLRGRVGRGKEPGVCVLVPSQNCPTFDDNLLKPASARERLELFTKTASGFEIGALDLKMRGPGELLGETQHGALDLEHFDFERDMELVPHVKKLVNELVNESARLTPHDFLTIEINRRFGKDFLSSDLS